MTTPLVKNSIRRTTLDFEAIGGETHFDHEFLDVFVESLYQRSATRDYETLSQAPTLSSNRGAQK